MAKDNSGKKAFCGECKCWVSREEYEKSHKEHDSPMVFKK